MGRTTRLSRPVRRRLKIPMANGTAQDVVVCIDHQGVTIRGPGCRRRKLVSWLQLMSLPESDQPILRRSEEQLGEIQLRELLPARLL